jgi:DoxX-like family
MFVLTAVVSVLLAAAMAQSVRRKINPGPDSLALRDRLGVPARLWTAVAVPETLAALGLVIGLWWAPLGVAAAVGVVLLMAGAIGLHLRARLLGAALISPFAVLAVAVLVAVLRTLTA